jgi:probable DNA repair protein
MGAWLPRCQAADAVATLADLARERSFDPASVAAPVTLTDSHDDPIVRFDGIWVAGLDAAQWPPPPRPDVFIPLRLQVAAGIPAASAAGQSRQARQTLDAWRAACGALVCSWAQLEGDAHRSPSPLLLRIGERVDYAAREAPAAASLAAQLHAPQLEMIDDTTGTAVNTGAVVRGGVRPLGLQAECGFHAYGEVRLGADRLEAPVPGLDPRRRGIILHKALELIWIKLVGREQLAMTDGVRKPVIHQAVEAAVVFAFRGFVPVELQPAVEREKMRIERLIEEFLKDELTRPSFTVDQMEAKREVHIAGGIFEVRIDRIDTLEGGGCAILDYKSGDARAPRWDADRFRDPQLLAYLLAERGRDVQALANVSLTRNRARYFGKASRERLLPGVKGMNPGKTTAAEIDAAWHAQLEGWLHSLWAVAGSYLAGDARVQPGAEECHHCHLTVLCRRVELADGGAARAGDGDE